MPRFNLFSQLNFIDAKFDPIDCVCHLDLNLLRKFIQLKLLILRFDILWWHNLIHLFHFYFDLLSVYFV